MSRPAASAAAAEIISAAYAEPWSTQSSNVMANAAVISVRVVGANSGLDRNLWTLVDRNGETRAIRANVVESSADGSDSTVDLVFSYSTDVSELSLLVGRSDRQELVASFEVQAFE